MSQVHFTAHVARRWTERGPHHPAMAVAFGRARYCGHAKLRTRPTRRRREMCYGYQFDQWVFVVAYRPACLVLTVWPVAWWDQKARQYARWWAQTYHQEEDRA